MKYNKSSHIKSVKEVETFFHHIVEERRINFHPDTSFEEYVSNETKQTSFSKEECQIYNRLMEESFDICEKSNVDIYEIGIKELEPYTTVKFF